MKIKKFIILAVIVSLLFIINGALGFYGLLILGFYYIYSITRADEKEYEFEKVLHKEQNSTDDTLDEVLNAKAIGGDFVTKIGDTKFVGNDAVTKIGNTTWVGNKMVSKIGGFTFIGNDMVSKIGPFTFVGNRIVWGRKKTK